MFGFGIGVFGTGYVAGAHPVRTASGSAWDKRCEGGAVGFYTAILV